jgi:pimeloyl-ACP methyl ester carboxylesterase
MRNLPWYLLALFGLSAFAGVLCGAGCGTIRTGLAFRQLDYNLPTRYVTAGGIDLAYTEAGSGPPVVLVHGLGSNLQVWAPTVRALAPCYRVLALDLPGYGRSQKGNYDYSMAFFARAVDAFLERLGITQPVLIGHSMGGQIALTHALLFPRKARALVLAAPAGFETFEPGEAAWLAEVVSKDFIKKTPPEALWANVANNFAGDVPRAAEWIFRQRVEVIDGPDFDDYAYANARSVAAMLRGPVFARLGEIQVPVLVVFGTEDKLIPNQALHWGDTRRIAVEGSSRLPRGRLVLLPRVGHMLQLEAWRAFARAVLAFLEEVTR